MNAAWPLNLATLAMLVGVLDGCGNHTGALEGPIAHEGGPAGEGGDGGAMVMVAVDEMTLPDTRDARDASSERGGAAGEGDDATTPREGSDDAASDAPDASDAGDDVPTIQDASSCTVTASCWDGSERDSSTARDARAEGAAPTDAGPPKVPDGGLKACPSGTSTNVVCVPGVPDCTRDKGTETCTCKINKRWSCLTN